MKAIRYKAVKPLKRILIKLGMTVDIVNTIKSSIKLSVKLLIKLSVKLACMCSENHLQHLRKATSTEVISVCFFDAVVAQGQSASLVRTRSVVQFHFTAP